ncbi:hypothetical protein [Ruminococcus flavefaciens]|uniref:Uncharacterized protein n=1 Tax=Ruminococcus flavefaciens 007c TaxID=1341157 RepID=W7V0Z4_RUMFL|nr:hypothetical protein [Ruminococcus flavefaciens]EWM54477.1 hypothetical protein RF007C_01650 [Ruminococcus flavefaciens 007c]
MKINVIGGEMDRREIDEYIKYAGQKYVGRQIGGIDIIIDGEYVDLKVHFKDMDFQRAYRSADYLVNSMEKLNDAKQKEFSEKERHKV